MTQINRDFPYPPLGEKPVLCLLTPFAGRPWAFDAWLEAFDKVRRFPACDVRIIWLDNSNDAEFGKLLAAAAKPRGATIIIYSYRLPTKNETVADLWRRLRDALPPDCDLVCTIEDDVILGENTLIALWNVLAFSGAEVRAASAAVPYRGDDGARYTLFWRLRWQRVFPPGDSCDDIGLTILPLPPTSVHQEKISCAGFGCMLVKAETFRAASLASQGPSGVCYDQLFGWELQQRGEEIWGEWSAPCKHLFRDALGVVEAVEIPRPDVDIVLLGYGRPLGPTIDSLLAQKYPAVSLHFYIVDSVEHPEYPQAVSIMREWDTIGSVCEAGFRAGSSPYCMFTNTEFIFPTRYITRAVLTLEQRHDFGFVYPPELNEGADDELWMGNWQAWRIMETAGAGSTTIIPPPYAVFRRWALEQIGGIPKATDVIWSTYLALYEEGWGGELVHTGPVRRPMTKSETIWNWDVPELVREMEAKYPRVKVRTRAAMSVLFLNRPGPRITSGAMGPAWMPNWNGGDMAVLDAYRRFLWEEGIVADHRWNVDGMHWHAKDYQLGHLIHIGQPDSWMKAQHFCVNKLPYVVSAIFHPGCCPLEDVVNVATHARAILCSSQGEVDYLVPTLGQLVEKCRIVPHGVDDEFLDPRLEPADLGFPYLLCVGRLQKEKGQLRVMAAAEKLGLGCVLVGTTMAEQKEYAAQVTAGLGPRVVHFDRVEPSVLAQLYRGAECVVSPSVFETYSLVGLEAQATGVRLVLEHTLARAEFEGYAHFLDPGQEDLSPTVQVALDAPPPPERRPLRWRDVVRRLIPLYLEALAD